MLQVCLLALVATVDTSLAFGGAFRDLAFDGELIEVPVDATKAETIGQSDFGALAVVVEHKDFGVRRCVEDELMKALLAKGYAIPSRSDIADLRRELSVQNSGLTNDDAARIGRFLNVPVVLIATVYGDMHSISARLVHVETIEILWVAKTGRAPHAFINDRALCLGKAFPSLDGVQRDLSYTSSGVTSKTGVEYFKSNDGDMALYVNGYGLKSLSMRQIEDELIFRAFLKGYSVPARSDLGRVLEELETQQTGLTAEDYVETGRMLNSGAVLVVSRSLYEQKSTNEVLNGKRVFSANIGLSLRVIDAETSRILFVGTLYKRKRSTEPTPRIEELIQLAGAVMTKLLPDGPHERQ